MTPRRGRPIVAAIAVCAALGACSSSGHTAGQAHLSMSPELSSEVARYLVEPKGLPSLPKLPTAPPRGKKVYFVNPGNASAQTLGQAIKQATDVLGWEYDSLTFNNTNPATGNSAYLTAVASGADGIISAGLVAAEIQGGLAAARKKNVEVVAIQSSDPPDAAGFDKVADQQINNGRWARVIALGILADAAKHDTTAHVGITTASGNPDSEGNTKAEAAAIVSLCASCTATAINVPVADYLSGQASKAVVSFIQRHPQTNYVQVVGGAFEGGLRVALDAVGMNRVKITGFLPTSTQNEYVKQGKDLFWVQVPSGYHAWQAVDAIVRHVTGANPGVHNSEPDPTWLVTQANLNFDTETLPDFPTGYREQFTALWGGRMTAVLPTEPEVLGYVESLSNWGRWGVDDQLGTLNLITPEVRRQAAAVVVHGATVSLARELAPVAQPGDAFAPPQRYMVFTGEGLADPHRITQHPAGREADSERVHGASEYIGMVFHGFNVTHVDALSHVFWDRQMYNGRPPELVNSLFGATSHAVTVASEGIVTRGVLLDVAAAHAVEWLNPGTGVTPADLELAESRQGVRVREGDAVLLRTGHGLARRRLGPKDPNVHGQPGWHAAALPWLHERGAALIGCDSGSDVLPSAYPQLSMPVHVIGIVAMGLWLVDNLDLEAAAATAERLRQWQFLFALAPLRLVGGTGSPANPLAVF